MKIPSIFYQFKNEKVLVVVSGTERAKLFKTQNGEMEDIGLVSLEKIKYSDKEGTYNAPGGLFRGGSVLDDVSEREKKQFMELLARKYDELRNEKFDYIALLAPSNVLHEIIGCFDIPKTEKEGKVRVIKEGNYLHATPEELFRLLSEALNPLAG
ncbi:MAG: hypothetical protein WC565_02645 [Parcubacteria group bacterium]